MEGVVRVAQKASQGAVIEEATAVLVNASFSEASGSGYGVGISDIWHKKPATPRVVDNSRRTCCTLIAARLETLGFDGMKQNIICCTESRIAP